MKTAIKTTLLSGLLGASTVALSLSLAGTAMAQSTTSTINGVVASDAGAPISNATILIVDSTTGFTRTVTTDANGQFSVRNLSVGGSYDVSVTGAGFQGERVEGLNLTLGGTSALNFNLSPSGNVEDEIIVVAQRQVLADVALGPNASFGLDTLENAPAINRDIKDIVRLDPRIYVDESFNDSIQCAGASPRFNSLTLDGLRLNDNFGLNSNGYPTERIPFSYDAIQQVAVELAPVDVQYGGFTACNINAVTKSGTNEIEGGFFFDYTSDTFKGMKADGEEFSNDGFEEYRYGVHAGGPIIKDKLFVFAAYEKLKGSNLFGANNPESTGILQSQYDQIINIATNQYGYVSGGLPSTQSNFDEKFLAKIDWNINDSNRAEFTYVYNDGNNISGSDTGSTRLSDGNHFYERGAKINSYTGSLYSDWTENFSTELRGSYIKLDNRQIPVAGTEFGEIQVRVPRTTGGTTTVYLGADDSRHANKLNYDLFTIEANANYKWKDHLFTVGVEHEEFDVFNLFVQEAEGEWVFDNIADFASGRFSDFRYESAAGTNNVDDAAAEFGFGITTLYAQDEWQVSDALGLTFGLRLDTHSSNDVPTLNVSFRNQFGLPNNVNLDGKTLIQPRFGFNYQHSDTMTFHGGVGLFSGGNPNVWLSNNYSNNGVTQFEFRCRSDSRGRDRCNGLVADPRNANISDFTYPNNRPFFDIPDQAFDAVANANGRGSVNTLDPEFDLPSEWKFALGTAFELNTNTFLGGGYGVNLDVLYSKTKDAAIVRSLDLIPAGTAPDGRQLYGGNPFNGNYVLTNTDEKGSALTLSAAIRKEYDNGVDWSLAYAYNDAEDVNPMTSSVAFSNYNNITSSDIQNPGLATTNYQTKHRFTSSVTYRKDFFEDLTTTFSMFASIQEGRPFSYTFTNCDDTRNGQRCENLDVVPFVSFNDDSSRHLLYVPTGPNDPLVTYGPGFDTNAFFNFIEENGLDRYAGGIAPRNAFSDDWWTKIDLKIKQEFPGFRDGDRASAFIVLENALNFVNSDWGVLKQHGFPGAASVVDVNFPDGATNQYVYNNFSSDANEGFTNAGASLWEIRFGFNYDF